MQAILLVAEGLDHRLHPRNVAVMIGPPDVDQQIVAATELVLMIGDIGSEVRKLSILLAHHPILVVCEGSRPEPLRPVLLKQIALGFQHIESALHGLIFEQQGFTGPGVKVQAEQCQIRLNRLEHFAIGPGCAHILQVIRQKLFPVRAARCQKRFRHLPDVVPPIPVLWKQRLVP